MLTSETVDKHWEGIHSVLFTEGGIALRSYDLVHITNAVMAYLESEGLLK